MANYGKEPRMRADIQRREKVEKAIKFVKKIWKMHKETIIALRKAQGKIKQQADKEWKETEK